MRNIVIAAAVLVTSIAHAETPRYSRKQQLKLDVKLSERVKGRQPSPKSVARPVSADTALRIIEDALPIRREQEAVLMKLIADTPDDDADKPEYMFRLAELYAHQLRFWRLKATEPTMPTRAR